MHTQDRPSDTTHLVGRIGLGTGLAILAFLAMLVSGFSQPVGAQTEGPVVVDPASCGHYETQADAQADLDAHPEFAASLDSNGDGVACDEFQTGGPVVVDPASCGHFEFREDAQIALEQNPELALSLDGDGNGIACETLPSKTVGGIAPETTVGTSPTSTDNETVIALPNTGAGFSKEAGAGLWLLPISGLVVALGGLLSWPRPSRRMTDTRS